MHLVAKTEASDTSAIVEKIGHLTVLGTLRYQPWLETNHSMMGHSRTHVLMI